LIYIINSKSIGASCSDLKVERKAYTVDAFWRSPETVQKNESPVASIPALRWNLLVLFLETGALQWGKKSGTEKEGCKQGFQTFWGVKQKDGKKAGMKNTSSADRAERT